MAIIRFFGGCLQFCMLEICAEMRILHVGEVQGIPLLELILPNLRKKGELNCLLKRSLYPPSTMMTSSSFGSLKLVVPSLPQGTLLVNNLEGVLRSPFSSRKISVDRLRSKPTTATTSSPSSSSPELSMFCSYSSVEARC